MTHRQLTYVLPLVGTMALLLLASCGESEDSPEITRFSIPGQVGYTGHLRLTFSGDATKEATVSVFRVNITEGAEDADPELLLEREVEEPYTFSYEENIIFMEPGKFELYGTLQVGSKTYTTKERPVVTVSDTKVDVEGMQRVELSRATNDKDQLIVGRTYGMKVVWFPHPEPTNTRVIWTSSDESVAQVSSSGDVTIMEEGTAIITATSEEDPLIGASIHITGVYSVEDNTPTITVSTSATPQNVTGVGNLATDVRFTLSPVEEDGVIYDSFIISFAHNAAGISQTVEYSVPGANIERQAMKDYPAKDTYQLDAGTYTIKLWAVTGSDITVPILVWMD